MVLFRRRTGRRYDVSVGCFLLKLSIGHDIYRLKDAFMVEAAAPLVSLFASENRSRPRLLCRRVNRSGYQSFWCRGPGDDFIALAGSVGIVNPEEPHTGEAATPAGYAYRTLYLQSAFLTRAAAEIGSRHGKFHSSSGSVLLHDPILSTLLSRFHHCLAGQEAKASQESALYEAVARLITWHADSPVATRSVGKDVPLCQEQENTWRATSPKIFRW